MTQPLAIVQLGNPILRQIARPIENFQGSFHKDFPDISLQTVIDQLITTLVQSNGVGIAAPQVGYPLRLLIVASRPNPRYPYAPVMEPTALVNPRLISHSTETVKGWEGCLSVPGIRGFVPRYQSVEVEYCDRNGNICQQVLTDFVARIFQHEFDHLEGKVFLDRVESTKDLMTEQEFNSQILPTSFS